MYFDVRKFAKTTKKLDMKTLANVAAHMGVGAMRAWRNSETSNKMKTNK